MGTRSLTHVYDENERLVTMYRQFDGYLSGHGKALHDFLASLTMTNGLPCREAEVRYANGACCLAAQMIAHFKKGPGDIYIMTPGNHGQDYEYTVNIDEDMNIKVSVSGYEGTLLSDATLDQFLEFIKREDD